ncbi:MAG: succinyldiaminopimelate transaminase [Dermatophilaceae bacterium]
MMDRLPDFPWDSLAPYKERAISHAGGLVDLSVGTPVDPTPEVVRAALIGASDASGYPQTWGTPDLREAVAAWFARRRGVPDVNPDGVLPTVGSKEMVAWLPTLLGIGPGDVVALPSIAYPTYDVGARIAGASRHPMDSLTGMGPMTSKTAPKLMWVNSPSNPTGEVLGAEHLAKLVGWGRAHGVVIASDECYAELDWRDGDVGADARLSAPGAVPSILDPKVCGGSHDGLLAIYSLSKQSNMAGYRAAFVAGDAALVSGLLEIRKHAGMMMPWPVQRAMVAALGDDAHVRLQKGRYGARRRLLMSGLTGAGYRIDLSDAGLYLWATRDSAERLDQGGVGVDHQANRDPDDGADWSLVAEMADLGILVAPGSFYGPAGARHVRIALTATDERIHEAVQRLDRLARQARLP